MRNAALLVLSWLCPACVIHVHVHEDPRDDRATTGTATPGSHAAREQRATSVSGTVVDADGTPVSARVALVNANGSTSSTAESSGAFDLDASFGAEVVVHASTSDGRVAIEPAHAGDGGLRLVLRPGATVTVGFAGQRPVRCAVFRGDMRIEDFTLRPGERSSVVVPTGPIRLRLYDGDAVHVEREVSLARGTTTSVSFDLG